VLVVALPHPVHALGDLLRRSNLGRVDLAEAYTAILVFGGCPFPLLDSWDTGSFNGGQRVGDSTSTHGVFDLDETHGYQAWTAQPAYRLCDEPFGVGLSDYYDCFSLPRVEFIGSFGVEVVQNNTVDHCAGACGRRTA